jgi:hypothetical protein
MSTGNFGATGYSATKSKSDDASLDRQQIETWAILGALLLALVWAYWNTLSDAARSWDNPKYSHGYLVPLFTAALIWMRREPFGKVASSARWAGVGMIAAGLAMRLIATRLSSTVPEMYSIIPCVMGIFVLVGGWPTIRWAGPAVLFLIFMFPLPGPLDGGLLAPLQKVATVASTYALQTLGIAAYNEGNRIVIGELQMGVVEACSGLDVDDFYGFGRGNYLGNRSADLGTCGDYCQRYSDCTACQHYPDYRNWHFAPYRGNRNCGQNLSRFGGLGDDADGTGLFVRGVSDSIALGDRGWACGTGTNCRRGKSCPQGTRINEGDTGKSLMRVAFLAFNA